MNTTEIIVTAAGFSVIGWIVWYFWLWKGESVSAQAGAGGVLEIEVMVKGGISPRPSSQKQGSSCA